MKMSNVALSLIIGAVFIVTIFLLSLTIRTYNHYGRPPQVSDILPIHLSPLKGDAGSSTPQPQSTHPYENPFLLILDPKVLMIQAFMADQNNQPQDIYGKIIDQYGKPVSGVHVIEGVMLYAGITHSDHRSITLRVP